MPNEDHLSLSRRAPSPSSAAEAASIESYFRAN